MLVRTELASLDHDLLPPSPLNSAGRKLHSPEGCGKKIELPFLTAPSPGLWYLSGRHRLPGFLIISQLHVAQAKFQVSLRCLGSSSPGPHLQGRTSTVGMAGPNHLPPGSLIPGGSKLRETPPAKHPGHKSGVSLRKKAVTAPPPAGEEWLGEFAQRERRVRAPRRLAPHTGFT